MWWVIIIVCIIFGFICQPVNRVIKKNVANKWLAVILEIAVYMVILLALYGIAALCGYNIYK